jgi:hypothetical protein
MPILETSIRTLLVNDAAVAGLIDDRVYRRRIPQEGDFPCMVITRTKTERLNFSDGLDPLTKAALQVTCWSSDPDELESLSDAAIECLADYTGGSPVSIKELTLLTQQDVDSGPSSGTDDEIRLGRRLEFLVWYEILAA